MLPAAEERGGNNVIEIMIVMVIMAMTGVLMRTKGERKRERERERWREGGEEALKSPRCCDSKTLRKL